MSLNKGLVQVYTGTDRCATHSSLGLAFRALGRGLRVFLVRFTASFPDVGSRFATERFGSRIQVRCFTGKPPGDDRADRTDSVSDGPSWKEISRDIGSGEYDLIILDGINQAVDMNLVPAEQVVDLIRNRSPQTEIVLTGAKAHPLILAEADLISEAVDPRPDVLNQAPAGAQCHKKAL